MKKSPTILTPNRRLIKETEKGLIQKDPGSGYEAGQVFFANDSRFLETHFQEAVTNYAVGFKDPAMNEEELEFIAPSVPVGRRFEWKAADNAEEFLSETFNDQRAIGSDFKRVQYTQSDVTDKTINKGLTYIADIDNEPVAGWENRIAAKLQRRLFRNELRRGYTLLSASATNLAKTWDTTAGKDPDQEVEDSLVLSADAMGFRPNRIVYGDAAWVARRNSHRAQNTAGGFASASLTPEQLASFLGVDGVRMSKGRYQSAAAAKTQILGLAVYAFFAEAGVDREDPTHIKRFFSPATGGGRVGVFVQQISSKLVAVTVEHYSKLVTTFATGIRKLTITP